MTKGLTVIMIAAGLLQGCTPAPKSPAKKTLAFRSSSSFTVDTHGQITTINSYFQPQGSEKVYFLDPVNFSFHVLSATDGAFRLLGVLPVIDPDAEVDGFTVDEKLQKVRVFFPDSIAVYNFRGKQLQIVPVENPENGFIWASGNYFLPVIRNGKMYISYFAKIEGSFHDPTYFQSPVEAEVDLKTHKIRLLGQGYPANYRRNCYGFHYNATRMEIDANTHGYTFPHNDSIFFYNLKTGEHSAKFFGSKAQKQFEHIPFEKVKSLNETVFMELVQKNPHYSFPTSAPLAGYYFRELVSAAKEDDNRLKERLIIYDRDFNYVGENVFEPGFLIDSKNGLLSMSFENNRIILQKLSW